MLDTGPPCWGSFNGRTTDSDCASTHPPALSSILERPLCRDFCSPLHAHIRPDCRPCGGVRCANSGANVYDRLGHSACEPWLQRSFTPYSSARHMKTYARSVLRCKRRSSNHTASRLGWNFSRPPATIRGISSSEALRAVTTTSSLSPDGTAQPTLTE